MSSEPRVKYEYAPDEPGIDWQYEIDLVQLHYAYRDVPAGTGFRGSDFEATVKQGRTIFMKHADKAQQKAFLEAVLDLRWLPPAIRVAVMKHLGRSQQKETTRINEAVTEVLRLEIAERQAQMRSSGKRERGGIERAALEAVAKERGIDPDSLQKRFKRHRKRRR